MAFSPSTQAETSPGTPEQNQIKDLRTHNLHEENYVPWHERTFGLHSKKLVDLGELNRPNLNVVELGAGPNTFLRRAMRVVAGGGHFTAVDLDPVIVEASQRNLQRYLEKGRIKDAKSVDIKVGNANNPLENIGVGRDTADVVMINSVAANASPADCSTFLNYLRGLQTKQETSPTLLKAIQFLDNFTGTIPKNIPTNFPLEGVRGNVLVLLNAFLALKEDGRLVYAHNDQSMTHAATQEVQNLCKAIGFNPDQVKTIDPLYNTLNIKDIALLRPSKFDVGIVTANK